jgi:hypothetical protein
MSKLLAEESDSKSPELCGRRSKIDGRLFKVDRESGEGISSP